MMAKKLMEGGRTGGGRLEVEREEGRAGKEQPCIDLCRKGEGDAS